MFVTARSQSLRLSSALLSSPLLQNPPVWLQLRAFRIKRRCFFFLIDIPRVQRNPGVSSEHFSSFQRSAGTRLSLTKITGISRSSLRHRGVLTFRITRKSLGTERNCSLLVLKGL